jgi:hypothetical protein
MTQIKEGLIKSPPNIHAMRSQEKDTLSRDKKPSKEFLALVDEWANSYIKTKELPNKIIELAKKEGLSHAVVRAEIEAALRVRQVSERYIAQLMPSELKDPVKVSAAKSAATRTIIPKQNNTEEEYKHPEEWNPTPPPRQEKPVEEIVAKGAEEDEMDLPPEMQAIAAKVQQPEEDINVVILEERVVLVEKDLSKARDLVMRQLMQLKGRGWHIVELSARFVS